MHFICLDVVSFGGHFLHLLMGYAYTAFNIDKQFYFINNPSIRWCAFVEGKKKRKKKQILYCCLYHCSAGVEIYCAPTADARDVWQASMVHIALEGGCFVLSANQFCRRKDYPPPPDYVFAGAEEEPSMDSVVCAGGSVIVSPSGAVLAGPNYEGEALISADLGMKITA